MILVMEEIVDDSIAFHFNPIHIIEIFFADSIVSDFMEDAHMECDVINCHSECNEESHSNQYFD